MNGAGSLRQPGREVVDQCAPPKALNDEMCAMVAFKTSTLTASGCRRSWDWGVETTD